MTMGKKDTDRFLTALNEEKLQSQQRRADYNKLKISFIVGLFSIGSVELKNFDLALILYIIPFISICFDLYILGEDYGIKRIGGFIRQQLPSQIEAKWENWIGKRRDPFATTAIPLMSLLVLFACFVVLYQKGNFGVVSIIWFIINLVFVVLLLIYSQLLRRRLLLEPVVRLRKKIVKKTK